MLGDAGDLIITKLENWRRQALAFSPNIVAAIFILITFYILSRFLKNYIYKALARIIRKKSLRKFTTSFVQFLIVTVGLLIALGILNLGGVVTSVLAGAGAAGLIIGFAIKEIISNLLSGVSISITNPFSLGDLVELDEKLGVVEQIKTRATVLRTMQGQIVEIPNKEVINNAIINHTSSGERRIDIRSGISYEDDKEQAKKIAIEVIKNVNGIDKEKPIEFYYEEFGDSALNFVLRFWIKFGNSQQNFYDIRSEVITKLLDAYDENNITMPYPISTVKLEKESN